MKKQSLIERFQQLAGIKPLYEALGPRMKSPRPTGPSDPRSSKDIEFDNAQAMDRLTPDDKDKMGKIQQMMDKERGIDLNAMQYKKAEFIYAEGNGQFYALNLYTSKGQKQKLKYDEANEWLKNTLKSFEGVKTTGIDSLIPKKYNSGMEDLDLMVKKLRKLGIEASHNEYDFS